MYELVTLKYLCAVVSDTAPKATGSSQVTSTQYHSPSRHTMFQACSSRLRFPSPSTVMHYTPIKSMNIWNVEEYPRQTALPSISAPYGLELFGLSSKNGSRLRVSESYSAVSIM